MQPASCTIQALEEQQRKMQAGIERMAAASTLEEQQRIGDQLWAEYVERPRGVRRVQTARRVAPSTSRPTRPGRVVVNRRSRSAKTGTPTRGDPDDDPEPGDPWALTFVDRAPFFWRCRVARCRYMEWREGVDR
jgi:hypothetical protein